MEAQSLEAVIQGVAAGMLAQHDIALVDTHRLRGHDLIGAGVLQHAVLVDAGFVGEGVLAHHGLVLLHKYTGDIGLAGGSMG